jgi:CubicO group peptidase (beta-lactamase class C family)
MVAVRLKSIVLTVCLGFQSPVAFHQTEAPPERSYDFSAVENRIQQAIEKREIPSMVVAISKDGRIIYEGAFGYADIERKVPASVNTAYRLASLSKPITATGLMVLHQKGAVNIDASAEQYAKPLRFRSFAGNPSDVTLRHLLSHTSGLSSYFQYAFGTEQATAPDFDAAFNRYGTFFHPAGVLTEYSNLGYGLIGFIIARQSGTTFSNFMKTEVFDPLEMRNSFVARSASSSIQVARTYGNDLKLLPDLYNNTEGAGNLYSSAHDLMLFSALHLGTARMQKPILSREISN